MGSPALRWTAYVQDMDVAGVVTLASRFGVKNLEDILFADQYTGANTTAQLDAAFTDAIANGGLVVAPSSMGAGAPTSIPANTYLLDLRGATVKIYNSGSITVPVLNISGTALTIKPLAIAASAFAAAHAGSLRLGYSDNITTRNHAFSGDVNVISTSGTDDTLIIGGGNGVNLQGQLTIAGALTGTTTASFSGQVTSTLATGTAPLSITSTTVVPNLNVATLNGVTVSGAPVSGQSLVATGTTTAAWSGSAGTYKVESMQYTPTTFVSSAGGALFTYSLPANELALNQALRISSTGTWTNTSVATRTYTFTLKAGATTLYTWTMATSNGSVTNLAWTITFLAMCTAQGSSGTLEVQALENRYTGMTDPTTFTPAANTSTIAFDTTVINSLTLNVAQTNDGTTSTTGRQFMVERLG